MSESPTWLAGGYLDSLDLMSMDNFIVMNKFWEILWAWKYTFGWFVMIVEFILIFRIHISWKNCQAQSGSLKHQLTWKGWVSINFKFYAPPIISPFFQKMTWCDSFLTTSEVSHVCLNQFSQQVPKNCGI